MTATRCLMRHLGRPLLAAALSCGAVLVIAPAAGASAPAANKTCSTFNKLTKDLGNVDPADADGFDQEAFEDVGDAFHKAAKTAPKKVKPALNTLGSFYDALGGSDNAVEALQEFGKNGKKFTKATRTFTTYVVKNC